MVIQALIGELYARQEKDELKKVFGWTRMADTYNDNVHFWLRWRFDYSIYYDIYKRDSGCGL